jgi:hypothetical protein
VSSNGPTLDELISRRDELKINIDSDQKRDELAQVIGAITTLLHAPFEAEAVRLREMRAELAQELTQVQHERTRLRCAQGHAHGQRATLLAQGELPTEATSTSKALFDELHDLEAHIGELELAIRGIDGQYVALVEQEGIAVLTGVSAS